MNARKAEQLAMKSLYAEWEQLNAFRELFGLRFDWHEPDALSASRADPSSREG